MTTLATARGEHRLDHALSTHLPGQMMPRVRPPVFEKLPPVGLDMRIDTARVYRGEKLPRALPWETVRAFLRSIDRSTSMGRRDYAMFMLIVTYGLRTCEVASLKLDDIERRSRRL